MNETSKLLFGFTASALGFRDLRRRFRCCHLTQSSIVKQNAVAVVAAHKLTSHWQILLSGMCSCV